MTVVCPYYACTMWVLRNTNVRLTHNTKLVDWLLDIDGCVVWVASSYDHVQRVIG